MEGIFTNVTGTVNAVSWRLSISSSLFYRSNEKRGENVFGTVIIDAYTKNETMEIVDALEDLCSPNDSYGWASAGIYCFWDYNTHEVLYIGLASDLATRFRQHNGILPVEQGSKQKKIEEYFETHEKLGYSIFVQSTLSQPLVHRNRAQYEKFAKQNHARVEDMLSEQGIADIKCVEGILIEAYRKNNGQFPPWNEVGGSIAGQTRALPNNVNIVRSFSHPEAYALNPIVSRCTLRELSNNSTWEWYENYLHAVRMYMLIFGMEYEDAMNFTEKNDPLGTLQRMQKDEYFEKQLVV